MKVQAEKIDKLYLHLTFESRRDRDKFFEYIKEKMEE